MTARPTPEIRTGGLQYTRSVNLDDPFERAVAHTLGVRIYDDETFARDSWSALTNIEWRHIDGMRVRYSFRAAGDLVAALRRQGTYLDWYCCTLPGRVTDAITLSMAANGWLPEPPPPPPDRDTFRGPKP